MESAVISKMVADLTKIKDKCDTDSEVDVSFIINTMAPYDLKDLHLMRDCIDFVLIYNNL